MSDKQNSSKHWSLNRREFISGAAVAAAGIVAGKAFASEKEEHKHDEAGSHHAHEHGDNKNVELMDSALACVKAGSLCLEHCLQAFKAGDVSMAECANSVTEMLTFCNTLTQLAAHNSKRLQGFCKLCAEACTECMEACKKHADKHVPCKNCMESCEKCSENCKKFAA